MDEILFRLSNQIELLQIRVSVVNEHGKQLLSRCSSGGQRLLSKWLSEGQQLLNIWLSIGQQYLQDVRDGFNIQEFKESFNQILMWFHNRIHTMKHHLSSINFNPRHIYRYFINIILLDVSKKEFIYFSIGLITGTIIGYSLALNWFTSHHLHHIKAIVCQYYFGIQGALMIEDAEMPIIRKSNELLILVKAASIHEVDVKICSGYSKAYRRLLNTGKYKSLPVILGRDCAGVVVDIGCHIINFNIGDKVFVAVPSWSTGTMAEYIVVPETQVAKMPRNLSFEDSATLPYSGCLAWDALVNSNIIKDDSAEGKRILVFDGSTSIGCILIQLIKHSNGYVVTICKSQAAFIIKTLGVDEIIEFDEYKIYKDLKLQNKFDAIFFTGGTCTINQNILKNYLSPNGTYISVTPENLMSDSFGYISGTLFAGCIKISQILQYIFGANIYHWKEGTKIKSTYLELLQKLVENNHLRPILDKVYASHHIDVALSRVAESNAIGSTVVKFLS
ncbi:PREDICTED: reticulon-4-interacting protein 1, mitochondrial-like isoform X3 [Ceratosolen solmsi marchali]|uniref:Reticulon-4-interacting protein 1, mitochondrial-like isoform X3 n=1 Tax=Ceratosolen solmsi marchali TaxID=326594 RepID=A0AAJ6YXZ4_9HYME|nr:PREDICTED: reticulon-4-interacting protein 1, mitochondrial-like isoform X3 [Ceratosolen solmsi marchali]